MAVTTATAGTPVAIHATAIRELMPQPRAMVTPEILEVRLRTHRRTALVELFGELDLTTVGQVADTFNHLAFDPRVFSHVVLDLRGVTFIDAAGIHELVRQGNDARHSQHNLAIVRGNAFISRLMALTAVDAVLVLVESPEDLVPPPATAIPSTSGGPVSSASTLHRHAAA
jgi:anti-sigma B factor antagonist